MMYDRLERYHAKQEQVWSNSFHVFFLSSHHILSFKETFNSGKARFNVFTLHDQLSSAILIINLLSLINFLVFFKNKRMNISSSL